MIKIKNLKEQMFLVEYVNNENLLEELNESLKECGYELEDNMGAKMIYEKDYRTSIIFLLPDTYYSFQDCNYFIITENKILSITSLSKLIEFLTYNDIKLY